MALTPESIVLKGPSLKPHEISLLYDFIMTTHGGFLERRPGAKVLSFSLPDTGAVGGRRCSLLCDLVCIEGNLIAIGNRLGKGARGSVFSSFNLTQGVSTAVKIIHGVVFPGTDDDLSARVKRQVSLTRNMSSQRRQVLGPFIVKDSPEDSPTGTIHVSYLFSMPIAIGPLLKFMKRGSVNFVRVARSLLKQLHVLHTLHGFVHMDVKTDNVLVTQEGHIFLADYGEARPMRSVMQPFVGFKRENHPHMPPEMFATSTGHEGDTCSLVVDHSVDIFSLGYMIRSMMSFLDVPESANLRKLLNAMLAVDPRVRPTPLQALAYSLP